VFVTAAAVFVLSLIARKYLKTTMAWHRVAQADMDLAPKATAASVQTSNFKLQTSHFI